MFIDQIKVYARAGHGGKGAIAFIREAYRPKGGPSGGNGGRGGNVILQADHDLNNLIAQYYSPRLIAKPGEAGMGKGMDGHAGKDVIVKVPCGTLVWKLGSGETAASNADAATEAGAEPEEDFESDEDAPAAKASFKVATSSRPVIRQSGRERALEIDPDAEDEKSGARDYEKGELLADLTEHGQQFVLCKGDR